MLDERYQFWQCSVRDQFEIDVHRLELTRTVGGGDHSYFVDRVGSAFTSAFVKSRCSREGRVEDDPSTANPSCASAVADYERAARAKRLVAVQLL